MTAPFTMFAIRHAQTDDDAKGILTAHLDANLSSKGILRTIALSEKLAESGFIAAYCSDQKQSMRTAEILARPHAIEVSVDPRLREVDMGAMAGLPKEIAEERHPERIFRISHRKFNFWPLGGENREQVVARGMGFFLEIAEQHREGKGNILVVGHESFFQVLLPVIGCGGRELLEEGEFLSFMPSVAPSAFLAPSAA